MTDGGDGKKFGLLIKKGGKRVNATPLNSARGSVFASGGGGSDSEHEDELSVAAVNRRLAERRAAGGSLASTSAQALIQTAIEQDATVFQYDEIYDSMKEVHSKRQEAKKLDRKPKYAAGLLAAAEKRKVADELRVERSVQREREAEGDEFAGKEAFITESYKRKLEERKAIEEQIKREDALDRLGANKPKEFSGFYRNYLDAVCRDGTEKLKQEPIDVEEPEKLEDDDDVKRLESADSLADIKKGGLILPKKARANIRKREVKQEEEEDDEEVSVVIPSRDRKYTSSRNASMEVPPEKKVKEAASDSESNSGSSSESEEEEKVSPVVPYKPLPQVVLKDPEEERRERIEKRLEKIVSIFKRRNDEASINAAKERYLQRKIQGLIRPPFAKD